MTGTVLAGLTAWAEAQLSDFRAVSETGLSFSASDLLSERARINAYPAPTRVSSGGGCRLCESRDGAVALNLARPEDRELLPALFESGDLDPRDDTQIAALIAQASEAELVARGREMGLAIAGLREDRSSASPAAERTLASALPRLKSDAPRVVDLSALWAGPLASRLLRLAGADVIKVESRRRPDGMRAGDPRFFEALNQGKQDRTFDFNSPDGIAALRDLLAQADIVIESSRPRALLHLGIDADALVRSRPGQIWISITGHGVQGDTRNWIGFGDDCGVAGGLSAAHLSRTGQLAFVGDAIADPLTGIAAARIAASAWANGDGGRWFLSMSGIAAEALASC